MTCLAVFLLLVLGCGSTAWALSCTSGKGRPLTLVSMTCTDADGVAACSPSATFVEGDIWVTTDLLDVRLVSDEGSAVGYSLPLPPADR